MDMKLVEGFPYLVSAVLVRYCLVWSSFLAIPYLRAIPDKNKIKMINRCDNLSQINNSETRIVVNKRSSLRDGLSTSYRLTKEHCWTGTPFPYKNCIGSFLYGICLSWILAF